MPTSAELEVIALKAAAIVSGYGTQEVLHGVSVDVSTGEVVAVLGVNGAGKSTLLKSIYGLARVTGGRIVVGDKIVPKGRPRELLRRGVTYVPQGGRVFDDLTVEENLRLACPVTRRWRSATRVMLDRHPEIRLPDALLRRKASILSGGERQNLALALALLREPRFALLDEPTLGLDPRAAEHLLERIGSVAKRLQLGILIVEHRIPECLAIATRAVVLRRGEVTFLGSSEAVLSDRELLREAMLGRDTSR